MAMRRAGIRRGAAVALATVTTLATLAAGCATTAPRQSGQAAGQGNRITVVAAENFWGSIAEQLGGSHAKVTSLVDNPNSDPHDYEPTPADGREIATARFVIVNGIGYDPWAPKLVDASPSEQRTVLTVGDLLGLHDGDNPHRWYSPQDVQKVISAITADYERLDPADAAYFDQQKQRFEGEQLGPYNQLVSDIRTRYAGTPIGASESIMTPLADDLGLRVLTPESFLDAISEGSDPTAADKSTVDNQVATRRIKVFVYNSQNATPDVQALVNEAKAANLPIVTVTETPGNGGTTFQDWQTTQLRDLEQALAQATGR